jgi:hypothetical protein
MYDATRDTQRRGPLTQTYFAYGSNLDAAQMRARCPSAKLLGAAILDGYRLGFAGQSAAWGGGVATVVRDGEGGSRGSCGRSATRTSSASIASRGTRSPTSVGASS